MKAVSDLYSPVTGDVIAVNEKLQNDPTIVSKDPYGAGWLYRLKPAAGALAGAQLLSAADYQKVLDAEGG